MPKHTPELRPKALPQPPPELSSETQQSEPDPYALHAKKSHAAGLGLQDHREGVEHRAAALADIAGHFAGLGKYDQVPIIAALDLFAYGDAGNGNGRNWLGAFLRTALLEVATQGPRHANARGTELYEQLKGELDEAYSNWKDHVDETRKALRDYPELAAGGHHA